MSKKKELASEEWDFSVLEKAPRTLVHRAMQWELDRELGSGKEPFLKSAECRKALAAGGKSQKGSASGIVELGKASGKAMPFEEWHNFLIDWSQPREELINQFPLIGVGVLRLVDQDMIEAAVELVADPVRHRAVGQKLRGAGDDVLQPKPCVLT